ncbi:hypothetical protein ATN88_17365 [Enterovibrio coralii]|uniref:SsuA/THI5-like domain-containing protein n=1 Tax=Enterovibrio coralii TaxID=294935 RepID=A0A135I9P5_9GAMM|nr:hypothetical protein ATN88_17365 [Enterovibrio coralii]
MGWEPWHYVDTSGTLKRWAEKYGIDVSIERVDDYVDSLERFTNGEFDACTMTQMDALAFPVAQGVDTSVLIVGDYSNGNDGLVSHEAKTVPDIKGSNVLLVKYSVSHYLLNRALSKSKMTENDVEIVDTSDALILEAFSKDKGVNMVTWNPILQRAVGETDANVLFDSSQLPGEILDVMVVKTGGDERLNKVLVGAWFEVMEKLQREDKAVLSAMAESAGVTLVSIIKQLDATKMFYSPRKAVRIAQSNSLFKAMNNVRAFCFEQGLMGDIEDVDALGISFPSGKVLGDSENIKLRFDSRYMEMAVNNQL